jgi:hypothetical protein
MEIKAIGLVLAKAETTYGTDAVPTAPLNAVTVVGDTISYNVRSTRVARKLASGGHRKIPGFNTQKTVEVKFRTELRGNLNPAATPNYGDEPVTCDPATDKITLEYHTLANGDVVFIDSESSAVPTGLTADTAYYVVNATASDFQLAATPNGAAINFTSAGTGVLINSFTPSCANGLSSFPHDYHALLTACNLQATYTTTALGSTDGAVTYMPYVPSDEGPSVSIYWYTQKKLHKAIGCKGTASFGFVAGQLAYIDFTFMGLYQAVSDATFPTTAVFVATKPPVFGGGASRLDAYASIFTSATFDLGNVISQRGDALQTDGVKGFLITGRESKFSFNPEAVAEATHPMWADWAANTSKSLQVLLGTVVGNKVALTVTGQLVDVNYGDRDGTWIHNAQGECQVASMATAEGQEFQLKFY